MVVKAGGTYSCRQAWKG